jgi:hypothetical protein
MVFVSVIRLFAVIEQFEQVVIVSSAAKLSLDYRHNRNTDRYLFLPASLIASLIALDQVWQQRIG